MTKQSDDGWRPCPPGEFRRLAQRVHQRRRRRIFLGAAGTVAAAALFGSALGWGLRPKENRKVTDRLDCSQVLALADAYAKGQLDGHQNEQVRDHLAKCLSCAAWFKGRGR